MNDSCLQRYELIYKFKKNQYMTHPLLGIIQSWYDLVLFVLCVFLCGFVLQFMRGTDHQYPAEQPIV